MHTSITNLPAFVSEYTVDDRRLAAILIAGLVSRSVPPGTNPEEYLRSISRDPVESKQLLRDIATAARDACVTIDMDERYRTTGEYRLAGHFQDKYPLPPWG